MLFGGRAPGGVGEFGGGGTLNTLPNLAGVKNADAVKTYELFHCGIGLVFHTLALPSEVPGVITGELYVPGGCLYFSRAWYYWVVRGKVPLSKAREIYETGKDLSIRVAGHCANPHPDGWAQPQPKMLEFIFSEAPGVLTEERKADGSFRYIETYHIDTLEGLKHFVERVS